MPRHKTFIKSLGFQRYNSSKGWKHLKDHIANKPTNKKYIFDKLDQYQLEDKLISLTTEEFNKINKNDLNILGVMRMQKSLERVIEEKIKLEAMIVEILDDAAYAERFISKPK